MDTAGQSTETNANEFNRSLKRNIGELTMEIKINGKQCVNINRSFLLKSNSNFDFFFTEEPKSPARKEVKVAHEIHLRRELEQWKQLVNDDSMRKSIFYW